MVNEPAKAGTTTEASHVSKPPGRFGSAYLTKEACMSLAETSIASTQPASRAIRFVRRWMTFRLSTLLLAITALCVWLSIRFERAPITASSLPSLAMMSRQIDADIWRVAWNADGSRVALIRWDKPVEICEARTLFKVGTVGEGKRIVTFAFSPREGVVAFGENSKTAQIMDMSSGRSTVLNVDNDQPDVCFSPDGTVLATGGYGNAASLWDVESGALIRTLDTGTIGGLRVVFSPDGKTLVVGNRNSTTGVFEVDTGHLLLVFPQTLSHELAIDPTGRIVAVAYVDGSIAIWDLHTAALVHRVQTAAQEIFTLAWSPDGALLISGGLRGPITIWDAGSMTALRELSAPEAVFSLTFRPDQRSIVGVGGSQGPGSRYMQEWGVSLLARLGVSRE